MATRNKRSALIWKVVGLILAIALIFSVAYILFCGRGQPSQRAAIDLPVTVEIYSISLSRNDNGFECSFVPSVGNSKLIYTVTLHCLSFSIQDQVATAEYSNGKCTVEFTEKLLDFADYNMTLNISNEMDERNMTILTSLAHHDSGYSWSTP